MPHGALGRGGSSPTLSCPGAGWPASATGDFGVAGVLAGTALRAAAGRATGWLAVGAEVRPCVHPTRTTAQARTIVCRINIVSISLSMLGFDRHGPPAAWAAAVAYLQRIIPAADRNDLGHGPASSAILATNE